MASSSDEVLALLKAMSARLASIESKLDSGSTGGGGASSSGDEVSRQTSEFDELVSKFGVAFRDLSAKLGADAAVLGEAYLKLWQLNRKVIDVSSKAKKPDAAAMKALQGEFAATCKPIHDVEAKRDTAFLNHAKAAKEGTMGFQWIFADNGGLALVENAKESIDFWANKVRKESKDKAQPDHMTWANLQRDGFAAMHTFVKEHYKTGLSWNAKGGDAGSLLSSSSTAAAPAAAAAAPAPAATPAPAPAPAAAAAPAVAATGAGASAVPAASPSKPSLGAMFAQISSIDQSSGRTAGLRHVDKKAVAEEKVKAAADGVVPKAAAAATPAGRRGETVAFPTGTARCVKDELRWLVDFQTDNKAAPLHLTEATIREEVYIYGCKGAVIYLDSKVKGVRIDTCRDLIVFIDSALSGVEVVNSRKVKIQVAKTLPSVAIDKTDGIVVGLSYASRPITQIVTSKSSEMNVTFPVSEAADADWIEVPIPEQFVSKITTDGKLASGVSDLYTH